MNHTSGQNKEVIPGSFIRRKKSLGQNFLVDKRVLGRIVSAAEVSETDTVLEIGPGSGILTMELANRASRVIAIEIDDDLVGRLKEKFSNYPNLEILNADARKLDSKILMPQGQPYKVVANLPYYAASPIIRAFLGATNKPQKMVLMVQREVAQNMVATSGKMSMLSVATQLYGEPRIVSYVKPKAFRPMPKVTSAIVSIDVYAAPCITLDSEERFFRIVRAGFSARRKQLRNSLAQGLSISSNLAELVLEKAMVQPSRRAETLNLPEWGSLYESFCLNCVYVKDTSGSEILC
jgi:16S rRNA (adenine1518-N6/adenine1519-N6)-dimethyltransferase